MKRMTLLFCASFLIVGVLPIHAQGEFDGAVAGDLQAYIDTALEQGDPGVVLWVDTPNGVFEGVGGFADREAGVALQADDAFRVGSVSKMFTSVIILQLMEEGVLSLDDTLAQWLPEAAEVVPNSEAITISQMLNHSSGIHDFIDNFADEYLINVEMQQHASDPMELVSSIATQEADFAPGASWTYSNINYTLLGMVIEAATGQTVVENFHARIIDPLGLMHTYLSDLEVPTTEIVRGYDSYLGTNDFNASFAWTAGALVSNAPDMVTFMRALVSGNLFAQETTLKTMLTPSETSTDVFFEGYDYGLGIFTIQTPVGPIYGHSGSIFGFEAKLYYLPAYDVVLVNLNSTDVPTIEIGALAEMLIDLPRAE